MNKKFLMSWVAIFVLWMLGSFAVHGFSAAGRVRFPAESVPSGGGSQ